MKLEKLPATVVTGFLGSGKTTLMSHVLKNAGGKRIAVIVNEFGELDVDAELLRNCPIEGCEDETIVGDEESGIYELANGCICCTVQEEFHPVLRQLIERRDQIDHVLIETSGLALPKPLVQAFNWPDIKAHCTVDAVVTVVDAPAIADGRYANDPDAVEQQRLADQGLDHDPSLRELFDDQLSAADLVVLNKSDLIDAAARSSVQARINEQLPREVKIVTAEHGQLANDLLLGIGAAAEDQIESLHTHHDHHHHHDEEHEHAHDNFDSFVISLGEVDSDALVQAIETLVRENEIYRVKGFVAVNGKPMRQVIHTVGNRTDRYFDRAWDGDEERKTGLVVIGQRLSKDKLESELRKAAA
ncbi:MAG: cobalamin biosynthesis protein CobW [Pseudomonadota bacterium]